MIMELAAEMFYSILLVVCAYAAGYYWKDAFSHNTKGKR